MEVFLRHDYFKDHRKIGILTISKDQPEQKQCPWADVNNPSVCFIPVTEEDIQISGTSLVGVSPNQPLSCVPSCHTTPPTTNQHLSALQSGIFDQCQAINIRSTAAKRRNTKNTRPLFPSRLRPDVPSSRCDWCVINFSLDESSRETTREPVSLYWRYCVLYGHFNIL